MNNVGQYNEQSDVYNMNNIRLYNEQCDIQIMPVNI